MSAQKTKSSINRFRSKHKKPQCFLTLKYLKTDIAWHIDHSLKVINNVAIAVQSSDPKTYVNNFSLLGKLFFMLGFFPRGKAKAPKHVLPPETILKEDLISQIELAKTNIGSITSLEKNAYFKHPLFGNVNTSRIHRFFNDSYKIIMLRLLKILWCGNF